ncbi:MAG: hypothetical protein OHK0028_05750 [Deltaproteobacteria bacterium]
MNPRAPLRAAAPLLAVVALCGCAPSRALLAGPEAGRAQRFFSDLCGRAAFPVKASYSGIAAPVARNPVPFVAGVNATAPDRETLGVYDPLGRGVAFLVNDGRRVAVERGPAAELAGFRGAAPVDAGPVSLGRILSGAPAYPVAGGEASRQGDGAWVFSDARQKLQSDPSRRFLAGAEYRFPGMRVTVEYPGRASADPPDRIVLSVRGVQFTLRRDEE